VISAANSYNKTPVDDATTALLRSTPDTDTTKTDTAAQGTASAAADRGPAVLVSLTTQAADLATRQKALDALNAMPDDLANALSDQLQKGADALNTLDQAAKSTAADRKKDAEQKLERATKQLQLLQMLGADPKTMAQQAKDVGKQLKDAASEYTKALKDEAGGAAPAAAAAGSPADPVAAATTATATAAGLASTAAGATPDTTNAVAAPSQAQAAVKAATSQTAAQTATPQTAAQPVPVQAPQSAADKADEAALKYRLGQHERDVVANFKAAAKTVKQVMDNAAHQLKAKNPSDLGASGSAQVSSEMDKAVQTLADTVQIKQDGGDISDSAGSAAGPASAVDILA
jgi:hypothetical protein